MSVREKIVLIKGKSESVELDEVPNLIVCVFVEMINALENDMSKKSRIQIFAM